METSTPRPDIISKLRSAADSAFAIVAGMQLDVFTPLKPGPMAPEEIAHAIGVGEALGFNLSLISQFDFGESYTEQEHRGWLSEAGFVDIERANFLLPDEHGVMTARKRE